MLSNDRRLPLPGAAQMPPAGRVADSLARRYSACHPDAGDLRPVAWRAMRSALESWQGPQDVPLRDHLVVTIVHALRRHLRECRSREPGLPAVVSHAVAELRQDQGREPTVVELSLRLGRSEEDVLAALETGRAGRLAARAGVGASPASAVVAG